MTGNGNLQVTTPILLISDSKNLVFSVISNEISGGAYKIWQQLVTPWLIQHSLEPTWHRPGQTSSMLDL